MRKNPGNEIPQDFTSIGGFLGSESAFIACEQAHSGHVANHECPRATQNKVVPVTSPVNMTRKQSKFLLRKIFLLPLEQMEF